MDSCPTNIDKHNLLGQQVYHPTTQHLSLPKFYNSLTYMMQQHVFIHMYTFVIITSCVLMPVLLYFHIWIFCFFGCTSILWELFSSPFNSPCSVCHYGHLSLNIHSIFFYFLLALTGHSDFLWPSQVWISFGFLPTGEFFSWPLLPPAALEAELVLSLIEKSTLRCLWLWLGAVQIKVDWLIFKCKLDFFL